MFFFNNQQSTDKSTRYRNQKRLPTVGRFGVKKVIDRKSDNFTMYISDTTWGHQQRQMFII